MAGLISVCVSAISEPNEVLVLYEAGADLIFLEAAYICSNKALSLVKAALKSAPEIPIVAGNFLTSEQAIPFLDAGIRAVKIGYGWGSQCTSTQVTGVGRSPVDTFIDFSELRASFRESFSIIGCGGFRFPSDVLKAIALGADAVVTGAMFAGCAESFSEGQQQSTVYEGNYYQSLEQSSCNTDASFRVEGLSTSVERKGTFEQMLNLHGNAIKHGMRHVSARNFAELRVHASFCNIRSQAIANLGTVVKSNSVWG